MGMADLVKYPAEVLQAVYKTHRHADLDKVVSRIEQGQRRFYGEDVVLAVTLDLWDRDGQRIRLYQQERQVLRAIYVLAHQQNSIIVEFTPAQLMEVLGYAKVNANDFSPTQRQQVLRALNNLFQIHAEVEMKLGSGGTKKIYGHFLDSYAVYTDRDGKVRKYAVQINVLIGLDLSRFKLMPANLPKLITRHGPDQAVTTFADFCLLWEGQTVEWGQEGCRAPVERFYELLGAKASERKLARDAAVVETLLAEGFNSEDLTFAVEWAITHIPRVKSFGLIPYIMHQALKARDDVQHAAEAQREAEARIDEQIRRDKAMQEKRRRLAEIRASLSEDTLAALHAQASGELAKEGSDRTRVGYELLLKLKMEELIEQRFMEGEGEGEARKMATVQPELFSAGG